MFEWKKKLNWTTFDPLKLNCGYLHILAWGDIFLKKVKYKQVEREGCLLCWAELLFASTTEDASLTESFNLSSPKQARCFQPSVTGAGDTTSMPGFILKLLPTGFKFRAAYFLFDSSPMHIVQIFEQTNI